MSDTPVTDEVRKVIKESLTSRTQANRGEAFALRELDRLERELTAERERREAAEAALAKARLQCAAFDGDDIGSPCDAFENMAKRAEAAEAECERLRADAERYRWLRGASIHKGDKLPNGWWETLGDLLDEDFDESIDAAREGRNEPQFYCQSGGCAEQCSLCQQETGQ